MNNSFVFRIVVVILCTQFYNVNGNLCTRDSDQGCTKCIAKADCAWCTNPEFEALNHAEGNHPRCNTIEGHKKSKFCSEEFLDNPKSSAFVPSGRSDSYEKKHISPQSVNVQLRVGQPIEFTLTYSESQDKPLDLYYIMDLSATMRDDKDTVSEQGEKLARELKKLTKDLQFGFGSFIDKPVIPFVSSAQLQGKIDSGVEPYGFKNHLSLTSDIPSFTKTVKDANISANLDAPEGGLDAIMQAISCDGIGWRQEARKLIVLATDGPFHIAGDGKLGGIVNPNDGACHMENNLYTHSTVLDYPSVAQLNSKVLEKKVHVIFAIAKSEEENHLNLYHKLSTRISNSVADGLQAESTNVVKLIRTEYQKISGRVKIDAKKVPPEFLKISIMADCGNSKTFVPSNECNEVKVGTSVSFKIRVELTRCPRPSELPTYRQSGSNKFNIEFSKFDLPDHDALRLEVEPLCSCKCKGKKQLENDPEKVSKICRPGSSMECGLCQCSPERHGRNCECSKNEEDSFRGDEACKMSNSSEVCSNRGRCECGVCKCNNNDDKVTYSGKYCQFDDSSCRDESSYEKICSERGSCDEGKCSCTPKYEGDKCQCSTDKKTCIEPGSTSSNPCNGNGICSCSEYRKCICKANYGGLYCQKCNTGCSTTASVGSRCADKKLQTCIKCHLDNVNKENKKTKKVAFSDCQEECKASGTNDEINFYDVSLLESISAKDKEILCTLQLDKCSTEFLYSYQEYPRLTLNVVASTSLTCTKEPPILFYIFGVIGGVLLIGILLLLLWKILTHIHDKREFGRFEKERAGARWDKSENPLYTKPTTDFQNPAYKG